MAEAFGIVSGTVGIATAFSACIECFGYVQVGRRFGEDVQTALLTLSILRLRLSRWGQAVHIYDDPKLGNPTATQNDLQLAKDAVFQILVLLDNSSQVAKKFRLTGRQSADLSVYSADDAGQSFASCANKMRDMAVFRQKEVSLPKLVAWALYSKDHLSNLTENISRLLDNLEKLFPATHSQAVLARNEFSQLQAPPNSLDSDPALDLLRTLSEKIDGTLRSQFEHLPHERGHPIQHVKMGDDGKARFGHVIAPAWSGADRLPQGGNVTITNLTTGNKGRLHAGDTFIGEAGDTFFD